MRVIKGRMKPINLSFAACGFLGIYHLGAASAFCKHGKRLLKDVQAFAGASAGSLVASVLLTAPEKIEDCNRFTYQFAEETRKQSFGAVTPGYDFMARLRSGMESILPPHAHELAQDRLYVSITNTRTRQNYLVSRFPSREDLIKKSSLCGVHSEPQHTRDRLCIGFPLEQNLSRVLSTDLSIMRGFLPDFLLSDITKEQEPSPGILPP
uniref:patatin-like phospholipase domain-containing protein 4 isoform X5 n=1 Tax=Ictidomys tridecemlineatus TaxID=43179 RepID=UPI001A9E4ECA|nr:patatin-like phospholipase domain-containing protein 4 isoform X5 [Ictidomys tridecemlineatus]